MAAATAAIMPERLHRLPRRRQASWRSPGRGWTKERLTPDEVERIRL